MGIGLLSPPISPDARWRAAGSGGPQAGELLRRLQRGAWSPLQFRPDRTAYRVEIPRTAGDGDGEEPVFVKHYAPKGLAARVRDFGLRRKPQRAFVLGHRLGRAGVGTPVPLGLFALGRGLWREALLVNEWVGPTRAWPEHLGREAPGKGAAPGFREGVLSLARLLGALHRLGLYHGDLPGNLVFGAKGGRWRPFLVDLEELHPRLSRRRRVKNLEELGRALSDLTILSLRDRWDFIREYAGAAGLGASEPATLWREGREAQRRRGRRARSRDRG
ncbi:MAG: lipopolysaccharide kinase InaA family protein [Thermodesulfobacteriota bacterium]